MINIGWGCLVCFIFVGILPVMLVTLFMILKLVMKRVVQFLGVLVFYVDRRLES